MKLAFEHLVSEGGADPVQISAFLTALKLNKLDSQSNVIALVAEMVSAQSVKLPVETTSKEIICDIVGTGGDGKNTFNVSTTAGIVAAGTGLKVYKVGLLLTRIKKIINQKLHFSMAIKPPLRPLVQQIFFSPSLVQSLQFHLQPFLPFPPIQTFYSFSLLYIILRWRK